MFENWIEQDDNEIASLGNTFESKAKEYGEFCNVKFSELPKVKYIKEKFEFFITHKLYQNMETHLSKL